MSNETIEKLNQCLKNPDRRHAIYPIIHHKVAENPELVDWAEKHWFAGIVGNVPYNRDFPNDQKDWNDTCNGFKKYIDRGMFTWIYDEKGYPSGSAGGTVPEMNKDFIAEGLYCYEYWRTLTGPCYYRADVLGDKLYRAMLLPLDGGEAIDVTHFATESGALKMDIPEGNYHLFMMCSRRLFDGTHAAESYSEPRNYISLSDKEATETFLQVTHENYAKQLSGEFGKGVRAFFTDEPSLIAWGIKQQTYPIVPWHRNYPAEFEKHYHYPIEYAVVAVVTKRGPDMIKRRCDFWEFIADTVAENYFGTIQEWCKKHGLKSSGHFLHEEKLQSHIYNYGSMYKSGKRMDWPGIDLLSNEPQDLMNTGSLPIARLLASFADVSGEKETFTEFSDMTSRFLERLISLDWVMATVNWHHALGINNFTSYHIWERFKEQDFTDLNKYTARIGGIMRQGKRDSRTAILYPEATLWAAYTPGTGPNALDLSPETVHLNDTFAKTSWELLHRQIDFDYIDEDLILDGKIKDGKLCYNDRTYECIVLPAVKVLRRTTAEKLAELLKNGISVISIGELPSIARESGKNEDFEELFVPFKKNPLLKIVPAGDGWSLADVENLPLPKPVMVYPRTMASVTSGADNKLSIANGKVISKNILSHSRILPDGTRLVFLCNMAGGTYDGILEVTGSGSVKKINPAAAEMTDEASDCSDGTIKISFTLKAYEGAIWVIVP